MSTRLGTYVAVLALCSIPLHGMEEPMDERSEIDFQKNQISKIKSKYSSISSELHSIRAQITETKSKLGDIDSKLHEFANLKTDTMKLEVVEDPSSVFPETPMEVELDERSDNLQEKEETIEEESGLSTQRGSFYIMPFIGFHKTNNLAWKSVSGTFQINENPGVSGGFIAGYDWGKYFADFQVSYFQNQMDGINIPLGFSGESSGVGFHFSGGGRIHFNEFISGMIGVGVGGIEHDVSFSLAGLSVNESDFLLSLHLLTGLELNPTQQSKVGLRYRWVMMEEMKLFSVHDLHLIEFYLGYSF